MKFITLIRLFFGSLAKNPIVPYSILLVVVITGVIFLNSYLALKKFEENTDALIKSRAALVGDVIGAFFPSTQGESDSVQASLESLLEANRIHTEDLRGARYLGSEEGELRILASTERAERGETISDDRYFFALHEPKQRVVTFLDADAGVRYWTAVKAVATGGAPTGVVVLQFNLEKYDAFLSSTMRRVYGAAAISLVIVILLMLNHIRFFRYAIRATQLEEVDRMKDDFISMASHELRSPLTALSGYLDLIQEGFKKKNIVEKLKEENQYLLRMGLSVERLKELVEDILNVSRIEQNRLSLEMVPVELAEAFPRLLDEIRPLALEKKLELLYKPQSAVVLADAGKLHQVVLNLLSNAIKYTEQGKVELSVKTDNEQVHITVADTGMGMSADNLKQLFTKFYRVPGKASETIKGTGLGLWISRELTRKMGGDITVESIQGVGSHFTVHLKQYKTTVQQFAAGEAK